MAEPGLTREVIDRLQAGDSHAFAALFAQYRRRLKQMLEFRIDRRLRVRADASDILQEVYIDAHQRMRHYLKRPELSFYVWLRQLTAQRLIDVHRQHLKAEKRDAKQEVSICRHGLAATSASMAMQLVAQLASPSQMAMQAEMIAQVEAALEGMDQIDREVLALRHIEEMRNSEVAEVLEITVAGASNRYMRALARLRDVLQELPGFFDED